MLVSRIVEIKDVKTGGVPYVIILKTLFQIHIGVLAMAKLI